jgi:hypothetical protein
MLEQLINFCLNGEPLVLPSTKELSQLIGDRTIWEKISEIESRLNQIDLKLDGRTNPQPDTEKIFLIGEPEPEISEPIPETKPEEIILLPEPEPQPEPEQKELIFTSEPEEKILTSESKPYSEAVALVLKLRGEPKPLSLDKIAIKLQNENYLNANGLLIWTGTRIYTIIQKDKKDKPE